MTRTIATLFLLMTGGLVVSVVLAAQSQDRFTLTSPNGIAFAEFKGYDAWPLMAPRQTDDVIKAILGNPAMITAFASGFPANGQPVPDGAVMAKVAWSSEDNSLLPGAAMVPGGLRKVQFMLKDARRFPDTDGWGYADFSWDAAAGTFKAVGSGPAWAKASCHQCHTRVRSRDFVFTQYAPR
jgi:hypothetical protein